MCTFCVCVSAHACVCVCVCVWARVRVHVCVCVHEYNVWRKVQYSFALHSYMQGQYHFQYEQYDTLKVVQ